MTSRSRRFSVGRVVRKVEEEDGDTSSPQMVVFEDVLDNTPSNVLKFKAEVEKLLARVAPLVAIKATLPQARSTVFILTRESLPCRALLMASVRTELGPLYHVDERTYVFDTTSLFPEPEPTLAIVREAVVPALVSTEHPCRKWTLNTVLIMTALASLYFMLLLMSSH